MSDPERGFRGVMSGALVLQSITVLLGLPVASADHHLAAWEIFVLLALFAGLIAACAFVRRPWIFALIAALQVVAIATWFIYPALGIMALIFAAVWAMLLYFHRELGRRAAAGRLPGQQAQEPEHD